MDRRSNKWIVISSISCGAALGVGSTTALAQSQSAPAAPQGTTTITPIAVPTQTVQRITLQSNGDIRTGSGWTRDNPVAAMQGSRIAVGMLSELGAASLLGGVSLLAILGVHEAARIRGDGYNAAVYTVTAIDIGLGLFLLPAIYSWTSARLSGNGSYWAALAGTAVGGLIAGATLPLAIADNRHVLIPWMVIAPIIVLSGTSIGYELTTHAPTPRASAQRASLVPGLVLSPTHQGVSFSGLF